MINLHESMVPGRDRTRDPWICSQTRICRQTRYRLRYLPYSKIYQKFIVPHYPKIDLRHCSAKTNVHFYSSSKLQKEHKLSCLIFIFNNK